MRPGIPSVIRILLVPLALMACGKKKGFDRGTELEPAVLGGGATGDHTQAEGDAGVHHRAGHFDRPGAVGPARLDGRRAAFQRPAGSHRQPVADGLTPFRFEFDDPPINFQVTEAHDVIDTKRATSGTEGIFVDGVFTGNPPLGQLHAASPKIQRSLELLEEL